MTTWLDSLKEFCRRPPPSIDKKINNNMNYRESGLTIPVFYLVLAAIFERDSIGYRLPRHVMWNAVEGAKRRRDRNSVGESARGNEGRIKRGRRGGESFLPRVPGMQLGHDISR